LKYTNDVVSTKMAFHFSSGILSPLPINILLAGEVHVHVGNSIEIEDTSYATSSLGRPDLVYTIIDLVQTMLVRPSRELWYHHSENHITIEG
jgi:hypothetical protein